MTILALPSPDWLAHSMIVSGPAADIAAFGAAAEGAGAIPWRYDLDRMREDWFLRLLAPEPAERGISVEGARILADTARDLVAGHHERVLAAMGHSRACPFDLHALIPVPEEVLALGPDDPAGRAWLWAHWGTTWSLRRVVRMGVPDRRLRRSARLDYQFFSADWTPWQALLTLRARWTTLVIDLRPEYGW